MHVLLILLRFYVLVVYIPILIVFYKRPHEKASRLFLVLQTVFWDWPLLAWMKWYASFGATALQVGIHMIYFTYTIKLLVV